MGYSPSYSTKIYFSESHASVYGIFLIYELYIVLRKKIQGVL